MSRSTEFCHMLKINEIATDCYLFVSWKKRTLKEVPSNFKINWILPHFENTWDCHRLLLIEVMEETKYPQISTSTGFFHILKINEIATDCYLSMSWKKRNLKETPSNFKITWTRPHCENKWDCHRLLFIYVMEEEETWKRYPHISRSTEIWHILKISNITTDCYFFISLKKTHLNEVTWNFKICWILPHFENDWGCHRLLSIVFIEGKKLERGTLKSQDQLNSSTFWK